CVDARGHGDLELFLFAPHAFARASLAGVAAHGAHTLAARAGALEGKRAALGPAAAALGAGLGRLVLGEASAVTGLTSAERVELHDLLAAGGGLGESDGDGALH